MAGGKLAKGNYQEVHGKQGKVLLCRLKTVPSLWVTLSGGLESPFSSWYKEGDIFAIEDFLFECKYPLQNGNFYSVFRTCACCFLKYSAQNYFHAKEAYFGVAYVSLYTV